MRVRCVQIRVRIWVRVTHVLSLSGGKPASLDSTTKRDLWKSAGVSRPAGSCGAFSGNSSSLQSIGRTGGSVDVSGRRGSAGGLSFSLFRRDRCDWPRRGGSLLEGTGDAYGKPFVQLQCTAMPRAVFCEPKYLLPCSLVSPWRRHYDLVRSRYPRPFHSRSAFIRHCIQFSGVIGNPFDAF